MRTSEATDWQLLLESEEVGDDRERKSKERKVRMADELMAAMRQIERMLEEGKYPEEVFTVRTVDVPEPRVYRPKDVRALRRALGVSHTIFAHLLGTSVVLVKSWEHGSREPSMMARRLLDTIKADPSQWLATVRETALN